ncbi:MAG: DUF1835 domain-containing protein [Sporolactobacillus sp.]
MMESLGKTIDQLTEPESKSLLLRLLMQVAASERAEISDTQLRQKLVQLYRECRQFHSEAIKLPANIRPIHIVCGHSAAGSLKIGLSSFYRRYELPLKKKVLVLAANLAIGPLRDLDSQEGVSRRDNWAARFYERREAELPPSIGKFIETIRSLAQNEPILIWIGDSATEQLFLRLTVFLLRDHRNPVRVINAPSLLGQLESTADYLVQYSHTGEIDSDRLAYLFERYGDIQPLEEGQKNQLSEEWLALSADPKQLRIWENGKIRPVDEDYFDPQILVAARRLFRQAGPKKSIRCLRLIGDVIAELRSQQQMIGDLFVESRIGQLASAGKLRMKPQPRQIRDSFLERPRS